MPFSRNTSIFSFKDLGSTAQARSGGRLSRGRRQVLRAKVGRWGGRTLAMIEAVLVGIKFP